MTDVLIKKKKEELWTQTPWEKAMCSWRQRLGRCFHKPRNAKDCQRTVGNERRDVEQTPFTDSEGTNPTDPQPWTPHLQICETTKRCSSRSGVPRYSSSGKLIHSPWAGAIHLIMNALWWGFFFPWDSHLLLLAPAHPPPPPRRQVSIVQH